MAQPTKRKVSGLPEVDGYILIHQIGSGTYATVYKAKNKETGDLVAIKCVSTQKLKKKAVENIIREIECLKQVADPHIVRLVDFKWDINYVYIIMEYCSDGDLSHFIKTRKALQENVAQRFLRQLASAIFALHEHNIAHLDLKPQNILLATNPSSSIPILKLADFGFALFMTEREGFNHLRGSPLYMAPEVAVAKHYDGRADLWSVGVILYETLFGRPPFASGTYDELVEKIVSNSQIDIPSEPAISPECRHLLSCLLQRDPNKRMSFSEFFSDPFIDLEHLPGDASLSKGCQYAELAVQLDRQQEYQAAVHMYCVALDYLMPLVDYQDMSDSRKSLRLKVTDYLRRVGQIRAKLDARDSKNLELSAEVDRLHDEAAARRDSDLLIAMMQAHNAQVMDARGDLEEAYSLYKDSLSTILTIVQKMDDCPRRNQLKADVNAMLKRAEEIKTRLATQAADGSAVSEQHTPAAAAASASSEGAKSSERSRKSSNTRITSSCLLQ